nr:MAG TPA: hypothetical protein [Caudoviricetes sp.]
MSERPKNKKPRNRSSYLIDWLSHRILFSLDTRAPPQGTRSD